MHWPFTCCYVRFSCIRDRVRHVLVVVVTVVFIKAPVLNNYQSALWRMPKFCGTTFVETAVFSCA